MNSARGRAVVEFSIAALLVAAGAVWFFLAPAGEKAAQDGMLKSATTVGDFNTDKGVGAGTADDADGDGLPDWDEALRGTNPQNPDTDGDKTSDGEEVRLGRNPREAGPNDKAEENLNVIFAKPVPQIFNYQSSIIKKGEEIPPIADSGLLLEKGESPKLESLRAYGNAIGSTIRQAVGDGQEELAVLNKTIGAVAPETVAAVATLAGKYEILTENLRRVNAPPETAQAHERLAAAYGAYGTALRGLTTVGADGNTAPESFQKYSDTALAVGKVLIETALFFAEQEVIFAPDEPGNIFTLP